MTEFTHVIRDAQQLAGETLSFVLFTMMGVHMIRLQLKRDGKKHRDSEHDNAKRPGGGNDHSKSSKKL
jgi:putative Mn2+ efflux pump MntP